MNVEFRARRVPVTDGLKDDLHLRLTRILAPFHKEILFTHVRIEDVNGPKGGVDKRCHIRVVSASFGLAHAKAVDSDAREATEVALERVRRVIVRLLGRNRSHEKSVIRRHVEQLP